MLFEILVKAFILVPLKKQNELNLDVTSKYIVQIQRICFGVNLLLGLIQLSGILLHLFAFLDSSGFIKICLISFLFFTKSFSIRSLLGVYKVWHQNDWSNYTIMFKSQPDFKFPYCLYKKKCPLQRLLITIILYHI